MKLLNLEALTKSVVNRVVKVGNAEHQIKTLNVQQFLEILDETKEVQKLADAGEFTMPEEVRITTKIVGFALPTLSKVEIDSLDLNQLQAIAAFAKGEDVDGVTQEQTTEIEKNEDESQEGK